MTNSSVSFCFKSPICKFLIGTCFCTPKVCVIRCCSSALRAAFLFCNSAILGCPSRKRVCSATKSASICCNSATTFCAPPADWLSELTATISCELTPISFCKFADLVFACTNAASVAVTWSSSSLITVTADLPSSSKLTT